MPPPPLTDRGTARSVIFDFTSLRPNESAPNTGLGKDAAGQIGLLYVACLGAKTDRVCLAANDDNRQEMGCAGMISEKHDLSSIVETSYGRNADAAVRQF